MLVVSRPHPPAGPEEAAQPVAEAAAAPTTQPAAAPAPAVAAPAVAAIAASAVASSPTGFHPPPRSAIPAGPLGDEIRRGEAIFRHTGAEAPQFVGNTLSCSNCHLEGGRLADAAPLWAAWVAFPAYRAKNHHVNTFAERMQGCFRFSMNGKAPPTDSKVLVALQTYSAWLAKGAPVGAAMAGRGYPKLAKPASAPDYARGQKVYAAHCALCHGENGEGRVAGGQTVFPPLWGPHSYNWGAGMTSIVNAAGFVKANMPLGLGNTLSDQDAWDVAAYLDSQERPQDPRFTGNVAETRKKFHDSPSSMYGLTVNGHVLGSDSVPPGGK
ncbi:MAG: c-type cytochrome [Rhodospirillales bacterium]|nr:c-type cytochrome [Rhodospirillales bacterium]